MSAVRPLLSTKKASALAYSSVTQMSMLPKAAAFISGVSPPIDFALTLIIYPFNFGWGFSRPRSISTLTAVKFPELLA